MDEQKDFWPPKRIPSLSDAHALGREGMERASGHAERSSPEWNRAADASLMRYLLAVHGASFTGEEFRIWAYAHDELTPPPDERAFGHVIRRASIAQRIVRVGSAASRSSHGSHMPLWREVRPAPADSHEV